MVFFTSMKLGDKLAVAPLLACIGTAMTLAVASSIRAFRAPDVVLSHAKNPTPWNEISPTQQVKLFSSSDYSKLEPVAPKEAFDALK
ncbi:NADH dehydrogenase [ubiquinone] 1 alpha subcomplex subunit 4-like 2 [Hydra vulgaris]|uniref:NADH dehydrogenase [ubiquinone] 1 alpha subcomplex subunit 4-like 2 n=1 Tax=Hydra vulgaris TaxID=6087 RepID=A0ABM4DGA2_HYDVU